MELNKITSSHISHEPLVDELSMLSTTALLPTPEMGLEKFSLDFWDVDIKMGVDIDADTQRLSFLSSEEVIEKYGLTRKDFVASGIFHGAIVGACLVSVVLLNFKSPQQEQVVEVAFGITDTPTSSRLDTTGEEDVQATRSKQDLPQLTKHATPDLAPPSKTEPDPEAPVVKEPPPKDQAPSETLTKKPEGPKPPEDQQKVKMDDYLKRKEQDLREVADKNQAGKIRTPSAPSKAKQKSAGALPKSPFGSSVPDAPPGIAPAGLESGTSTTAYDSYKTYLARQLKLHWQTPEGSQFSNDLVTIVRFQVNAFGHLIGQPEVSQPSGNKDFDNLVLEALQSTFPVTNKPPSELNPPVLFSAKYTSQGVQ